MTFNVIKEGRSLTKVKILVKIQHKFEVKISNGEMRSMDNSKKKFEMKRSMEVAQLNGGRKQRERYYSPSENGEVGYDFNHINLSSLDANCEQTIENLSKV